MTLKSPHHLSALFRSYEALHNWRALAMMASSFMLGGLAIAGGMAAGQASGSGTVMLLMSLLGSILFVIGINASGLMLVDQAHDQPVRGFLPAFLGGIQSALSVIGLVILLGLGFALVVLAAYLLSLLGRIPGVGGFFSFVLAGPLVVVLAVAYAVLLLAGPLMIAAVWHGEGFLATLSRAVSIVIQRPLEVFMHFLVLGVVVLPAVAFIMAVVFLGSMLVGGFFMSGAFADMGRGFGGLHGMGGFGMTAGLQGAGLSIGLVWFLAWSVVSLIYLHGMIFVYQAVGEGMRSGSLDVVSHKLTRWKQKLDEYKPRAAAVAASPVSSAPTPHEPPATTEQSPNAAPAQPRPGIVRCAACNTVAHPDDVFCGSCGHRLK